MALRLFRAEHLWYKSAALERGRWGTPAMAEQRAEKGAHTLRGPHWEFRGERRAGFAPLKLIVQPDNVDVVVTRTSAILGRHSRADIRLPYPEVSRRHCRVSFADGLWRITDLDSLNGVWINGERMHDAVLYNGDHLRIGSCELIVVHGTAPCVVKKKTRKTDPQLRVIEDIAEALPRQAG